MLRRTLLAGIAAGAAVAPRHNAAAQVPTTLSVMHCWPAHARFHQPIADAFTAANPGIKIAFRTAPPTYDGGHQQILREAVTNQLHLVKQTHRIKSVSAAPRKGTAKAQRVLVGTLDDRGHFRLVESAASVTEDTAVIERGLVEHLALEHAAVLGATTLDVEKPGRS